MNRPHVWKFMLSTLTLWLAFAVASLAQVAPISTCSGTSTCSTVNCGSANAPVSPCTITIGADTNGNITLFAGTTNITSTYACVSPNTMIQWTVASGTPAGFVVEFSPTTNPFGVTTAPIFVGAYTTTTPQNAAIQGANTCSEYTVAYCGGGYNCIIADPKVIVTCQSGSTCKPPPKAK